MNRKISKLINDFYLPLEREDVRRLYLKMYTYNNFNDASKTLKENQKYIKILQEKFKRLVILRNNLAKKHNFSNFWEFIVDWDGIPKANLNNLKKESIRTIQIIREGISPSIKHAFWFNSVFNNLNFKYSNTQTVNIPEDIFQLFLNNNLCTKVELSQIATATNKTGSFYADFNEENKTALIDFDPTGRSQADAVAFAHELGHALHGIRLLNKKQSPHTLTSFNLEAKAVEAEFKYLGSYQVGQECIF